MHDGAPNTWETRTGRKSTRMLEGSRRRRCPSALKDSKAMIGSNRVHVYSADLKRSTVQCSVTVGNLDFCRFPYNQRLRPGYREQVPVFQREFRR